MKFWIDTIQQKNHCLIIELLKEIRSNISYMDTSILAMTGYAFNSDKINFINNGFTNYIAKPFSKQQLLNLVEETLSIAV